MGFIEKRCPERRPYLRHPTSVGQLEVTPPPHGEKSFSERRRHECALLVHSKPGGPVGCGDIFHGCVGVWWGMCAHSLKFCRREATLN